MGLMCRLELRILYKHPRAKVVPEHTGCFSVMRTRIAVVSTDDFDPSHQVIATLQ